jgi:hypothetical protein
MLPGRTARRRRPFGEVRLLFLTAVTPTWIATLSTRVRRLLPLAVAATVLAACSQDDPFRPIATTESVVSSFTVTALSAGVAAPSAIEFVNLRSVRPSLDGTGGPNFQIAFDLTPDGQIRLVPVLALVNPLTGARSVGLARTTTTFDALARAPTGGFVNDSTLSTTVGETWVVRVDPLLCSFGDPFYAKLVVDEVNAVTRRLTVRVLINRNCGYRDLTVGLPRN